MPDWSTVPAAGSRVLVTGAAGGLGRALSSVLVEVGAEVVGIDLPGTDATVTADLTDDDSARRAVADAAARLDGLDALVGAAGVVDSIHRAETFPLTAFRGDIEANLVAQFTVAQAAFPALREGRRPSIVLFSSVAGQDGLPGQVGLHR
jgi:NAD(P)-dependent dehydrogenase (short-subunit alcohol dehydrogenase family)